MKIGIYTPYLDTVGGGERYMLTIAEILSKEDSVDIFLDTHLSALDIGEIIKKTTKLLGLDLSNVKYTKAPFGKDSSFLKRLNFLKKYDILFYLTDGSIFYSTAKKNILHIQSPIKVSKNILKKIKSSSWDLIIYNSEFTKKSCENYWDIKGEVVYPPVNVEIFKYGKKQKQILTVGRFFGYLKDKKQEIMIKTFKKMVDSGKIPDWSFYLVGSAQEGDMVYVKELKDLAKDYPIQILPNLPFDGLIKLYSESSIYWHGAGYGETDPSKMEHFGITTVEAMASGCASVVINLGGQKEIIEDGVNGFLWDSPDELEEKTFRLIEDEKLRNKFSISAKKAAERFSKKHFSEKIKALI